MQNSKNWKWRKWRERESAKRQLPWWNILLEFDCSQTGAKVKEIRIRSTLFILYFPTDIFTIHIKPIIRYIPLFRASDWKQFRVDILILLLIVIWICLCALKFLCFSHHFNPFFLVPMDLWHNTYKTSMTHANRMDNLCYWIIICNVCANKSIHER